MALEQCAECGNTYRSQFVWKAEVTNEMVSDLSADDVAELVFALDEAVMNIASDWGLA